MVDPEDEWIDTATAAEHLGLTEDAVRKACRTGRFTGVARKIAYENGDRLFGSKLGGGQ